MTDLQRIALVAFLSALLRGIIHVVWMRYKAARASEPVSLRLRNGVFEPWGFAEKARWWGNRVGEVFLIYLAILAVLLTFDINLF